MHSFFETRCITSSPSKTLRRRLVRTTYDGRRGECSTLAAVRRGCFSHFATRTVDNTYTVHLYAAKPDIRPESCFCLPHLHSTPPLGGFPSEYRHPVWYAKTRMVWLPDGEKISKISSFVLKQLTNVTDTHRHRTTA